jgi:hypothetical protein
LVFELKLMTGNNKNSAKRHQTSQITSLKFLVPNRPKKCCEDTHHFSSCVFFE